MKFMKPRQTSCFAWLTLCGVTARKREREKRRARRKKRKVLYMIRLSQSRENLLVL